MEFLSNETHGTLVTKANSSEAASWTEIVCSPSSMQAQSARPVLGALGRSLLDIKMTSSNSQCSQVGKIDNVFVYDAYDVQARDLEISNNLQEGADLQENIELVLENSFEDLEVTLLSSSWIDTGPMITLYTYSDKEEMDDADSNEDADSEGYNIGRYIEARFSHL